MIERLWVEVNNRVNYPIKQVLIEMDNRSDINMGDSLCKFCVSWFSIQVAMVGVNLFVQSWNSHPIPGIFIFLVSRFNSIVHILHRQTTGRNGESCTK